MIWQAGGDPYAVSGTKNVTINLQDDGTKKFADPLEPADHRGPAGAGHLLVHRRVVQRPGHGTIASLVTGALDAGVDLESGVPSGKGDWRVAPTADMDGGHGRDLRERRQRGLGPEHRARTSSRRPGS